MCAASASIDCAAMWQLLSLIAQTPFPQYLSEFKSLVDLAQSRVSKWPKHALPSNAFLLSMFTTRRKLFTIERDQEDRLVWNLEEVAAAIGYVTTKSGLSDRAYCMLCAEQLPNLNKLVEHLRGNQHVDLIVANFIKRSSVPCYCAFCKFEVTSVQGLKSHIRSTKHLGNLFQFFKNPYCVLCDTMYQEKQSAQEHEKSRKHVQKKAELDAQEVDQEVDFTWSNLEKELAEAEDGIKLNSSQHIWEAEKSLKILITHERHLNYMPPIEATSDFQGNSALSYIANPQIKVSDPCKDGVVLEMNSGDTVLEVLFKLENLTQYPLEVKDFKFFFLDKEDASALHLGVMRPENPIISSHFKGAFTLYISPFHPGYFEFYLVVEFEGRYQVTRHLRFLAKEPVQLKDIGRTVNPSNYMNLPILLHSKDSKILSFRKRFLEAQMRNKAIEDDVSSVYRMTRPNNDSHVLASLSDDETYSVMSAMSSILPRIANKAKR